MSEPHRIAILGFSEFERSALVGYFRLSARQNPSFVHVLSVDDARLVIADADHPEALELLRLLDRVGDAVFVGARGPEEAAGWIMRPISQQHVLEELAAALQRRDHPDSTPLPLGLPSSRVDLARRGTATLEPAASPHRRSHELEPTLPAVAPGIAGPTATRRPVQRHPRQPIVQPRALLVDDSEIALHFLSRQLQGYGLTIDAARHSMQAIDLMAAHRYGIVFLDLELGHGSALDGLELCQQIRHELPHGGGGPPPVVAIVSAYDEPIDRVRCLLAGAEFHLGKPLDFAMLDAMMTRLGFGNPERTLPAASPAARRQRQLDRW